MSLVGRSTQGLFPQDEGSQGAVCMINIADLALDTAEKALKATARGGKKAVKLSATGIKSVIDNRTSLNKDLAELAKNGDRLDSIHISKKDKALFRNAFKKYGVEFAEAKTKDEVKMYFKSNDYDRVKESAQSIIDDLEEQLKQAQKRKQDIVNKKSQEETITTNSGKTVSAISIDEKELENIEKEISDIEKHIGHINDLKTQIDLQSLVNQNKELNSIDISKTDLSQLESLCKKYCVEIAVVEAADKSYHVFFKAQDYTRLESALKDISFDLDKSLNKDKAKEAKEVVNAEYEPVKGERVPMKDQIIKAQAKADQINKQRQQQQMKNRSKKRPDRTKGGAR